MYRRYLLCAISCALCVLSGCASLKSSLSPPVSSSPSSTECKECGTVIAIDPTDADRTTTTAAGPVLGGIIGSIADAPSAPSTQKSNHSAHAREQSDCSQSCSPTTSRQSYDITINMNDGRTITVNQTDINGISVHSHVRVANSRAYPEP